jgi:Flp pilus assembly pilin Flp
MRQFSTVQRRALVGTAQSSARAIEICRAALLSLLLDCSGQDFLEYALMAAFVATTAATISPTFANGAFIMFSKVTSVVNLAGS